MKNSPKKAMDLLNTRCTSNNPADLSGYLQSYISQNDANDLNDYINYDDNLIDTNSFLKNKKKPKFSQHKKWTKEEDMKLLHMVEIFGFKDWRNLSKNIEGRNTRQCRERWQNYLNPNLNHENWTLEEDNILLKMRDEYGPKWKLISKYFTNRTDQMIKNRYNALIRIDKKINKKDNDKNGCESDNNNYIKNSDNNEQSLA